MTIYTLFLKTEIFIDINVEIDGDIIFQTSEYRAWGCRPEEERDGDAQGEGAERGEEGAMDGQPCWPRVGKTGQLPHPILVQEALS